MFPQHAEHCFQYCAGRICSGNQLQRACGNICWQTWTIEIISQRPDGQPGCGRSIKPKLLLLDEQGSAIHCSTQV
ncbi:hypothetical protein CGERO_05710 [Corynebacterium gerontici]|uniref:Uncharacterized protein n=1 Tax=Corynebacterium gerontici TaxID=2079234 RepID=A0A3G6J0H1_9CORY|nr:hypothetical protein CGERO_05710 [Corynebacterium gerontici]